uniref:Uncharacterized protein n=1 Tax=Anguilla anguilla TaxID=7936 RepID=A0A0E9X495_ANGAN
MYSLGLYLAWDISVTYSYCNKSGNMSKLFSVHFVAFHTARLSCSVLRVRYNVRSNNCTYLTTRHLISCPTSCITSVWFSCSAFRKSMQESLTNFSWFNISGE